MRVDLQGYLTEEDKSFRIVTSVQFRLHVQPIFESAVRKSKLKKSLFTFDPMDLFVIILLFYRTVGSLAPN